MTTPPNTPPSAYPSAQPVAGARNTIGVVALIVGVATLVLSTVTLVIQSVMVMQPDYDFALINLFTSILTAVGGVLALTAVALGAFGLTRKGPPKGAAGIGLGIGVATLWAILGNVIFNALVGLLYG